MSWRFNIRPVGDFKIEAEQYSPNGKPITIKGIRAELNAETFLAEKFAQGLTTFFDIFGLEFPTTTSRHYTGYKATKSDLEIYNA